jgi:hypothetical protein
MHISSTTGNFETTNNSWELAAHDKILGNSTESAEKNEDESPDANSCMVADFIQYKDPEC